MHLRRKLKKKLNSKGYSGVIDLTAMTDMIFILLIFFILTSNVAQNVFDFEIPKSDPNYKEERQAGNQSEIKITLFASGEYAINEQKFKTYEELKKEIKKIHLKNKNASFLIISESTLPVQNFMQLLTFFKSENISKVDILVRKE